MEITIGKRKIGERFPTYFIADIAANHDGDLDRAKELVLLAKEAGADAAKFQNFSAARIVSDYGFKSLNKQLSHQSKWNKSVFEVYEDASIPLEGWTSELKNYCDKIGIEYFSSPYDFNAIDYLYDYMSVYKIGSGEITWVEIIEYIAKRGKPVILATGASNIGEVQRAVHTILEINPQLCVMQCNTNYTASLENFNHIHLRVLETYRKIFPQVILGLSDHTPSHTTVLGAVVLGAKMIEKHFTDDTSRVGPDHAFSMDPDSWADMVQRTRELERALGSSDKIITDNEKETVIVQRRCLRASRDIKIGEIISRNMIDVLRPVTPGAILPYDINNVVGTRVQKDIPFGKELRWIDLGSSD